MSQKRTALITGAGRGIGAAIAKRLAQADRRVLIFDIDPESAKNIEAEIRSQKGEAYSFAVDVTNKSAILNELKNITDRFGGVDILVNNAGITRDNLLERISEEDWDQVMQVNVKSAFLMSQAVVSKMKENKFGRIVNISSRTWLGNIGQANYTASKGALVSLTRTLALELAKFEIMVNAVAPGFIDTEMSRKISPQIMEKLIRMQPTGKIGKVDDIASAVEFLTRDETTYITGQVLHVDGGKSCGLLSL